MDKERAARAEKKTRSRKKTRARHKRTRPLVSLANVPPGVLLLICVFAVTLCFLFLRSWTISLNKDVTQLQQQLTEVNAEIDSKNGRFVSNADLQAIEAQARALGMTEARPEQFVYETAAKKQTVLSDSPVGLYNYLSFFRQVRNGNLWPQKQ